MTASPSPSTVHGNPAGDRRRAEDQLQAFAELLARTGATGVQLGEFARALGRLAAAHRGATDRLREQLRRNGYPVPVVVTVRTPTGTECRRIIRHVGGWSA